MRKTLLNALKHGSGILLTIFALLCSCQVWASVTVTKGEVIRINTSDHSWFKNDDSSPRLYLLNSTSSDDGAVMVGEAGSYDSDNVYNITIDIDTDTKTGNFLEVRRYSVTKGENNTREFYVSDRDAGYSSIYLNTSGTLEWERCFSTGDKFYLLNTSTYRVGDTDNQMWYQNGTNGSAWIHLWSNPSSGTYDAEFTLLSGTAETTDAIYQAAVSGCYAHFLITRNSSESTGPFDNEWNQSANYVVPPVNNRITGTTSSDFSSDFYLPCTEPTVTTASSPATTAISATCTGTYSTGGNYCEPASVGIAYKETVGGEYADKTGRVLPAGTITADLSDLVPGTGYTYKAYVVLDNNTRIEGSEQTFTTGCPTISIPSGPSTSDVSYCDGSVVAALAVTATSSPNYTMEYQWYSSANKSSDSSISGATESSYTPSSGTLYYRCKVRTNSACDASAQTSNYSGLITFDPSRVSPIITASATSVTNYAPVTLTVTGADVTTWSVSGGVAANRYLYKESVKGAMFKGTVGSGSDVAYTITGTASNGCSSAVSITVSSNTHHCR